MLGRVKCAIWVHIATRQHAGKRVLLRRPPAGAEVFHQGTQNGELPPNPSAHNASCDGAGEESSTLSLRQPIRAFTYDTLATPTSFRLLRIDPTVRSSKLLSFMLETFDRTAQDSPAYSALSYPWGDRSRPKTIILNSYTFAVMRNLYDALLHIRDIISQGFLWIDALCINQWTTREKTHQVSQLKSIYTGAREVLSWLGTGHGCTDELFRFR